MPLTLEDFLAAEPSLAAHRRELASCDRHSRREKERDEAALVRMLASRWDAGVSGWMTPDEARQIADELTADAKAQQIDAWADVRYGYLVFAGGRAGEQLLALAVTSPVRARKHWPGYLSHYAPPARVKQQSELFERAIRRLVGWATGKKGQR